jgi:hypothetical protein
MRVHVLDEIFRYRPQFAGSEEKKGGHPMPIVAWAAGVGILGVSTVVCGVLALGTPLIALVVFTAMASVMLRIAYQLSTGLWAFVTAMAALLVWMWEIHYSGLRVITWGAATAMCTYYGTRFVLHQLSANRSLADQMRVLRQEISAPRSRDGDLEVFLTGPKKKARK